jgi:hypothetical protein
MLTCEKSLTLSVVKESEGVKSPGPSAFSSAPTVGVATRFFGVRRPRIRDLSEEFHK